MVCKDEKLVNDVTGCFDWVGGLISLRNPKINKLRVKKGKKGKKSGWENPHFLQYSNLKKKAYFVYFLI